MNLITLVFWLALFFQAPARSPVPVPVPVEKEPRHHLKFENQYVRVFDVLIAPGDTTLFHTHINDGVGIKLTDARITEEQPGGNPVESTVRRGDVGFTHYPSPLTHRVSNVGSTPFRNMFVEVLPSTSTTTRVPSLANAAGHTLVLENDRVRIFRLVLAPGKSTEVRWPEFRGVRIAVSGGKTTIEGQSKKIKTVRFEPGDYQWFGDGMKYSWRNIGSSSVEVIDIELK